MLSLSSSCGHRQCGNHLLRLRMTRTMIKQGLGPARARNLMIRNKSSLSSTSYRTHKLAGLGSHSLSTTTTTRATIPLRISEEIREAVKLKKPVVALESAIITHGMPYPDNIQTAMDLQNIMRQQGVIPATVGVIKGQLTVGLSDQEIDTLGSSVLRPKGRGQSPSSSSSPQVLKVSRRDLPFVLSQRLNGGTTVSGTIIGAVKAKIPIFVTGGLGGVHRGAETTFDISADLRELGRSPIAVVSAGVKSILDIGKTLEYLETEGVCVCVLAREEEGRAETDGDGRGTTTNMKSIKFPSFFTAESPYPAPYAVRNETEAANLLHSAFHFGLGSGILIALPIPKECAASGERIERAIEIALKEADAAGIRGKDMTPFLLSKVNELTGGESLGANKHLIENNARVGAKIALELAALRCGHMSSSNSEEDGDDDGSKGSGGGDSDYSRRRKKRSQEDDDGHPTPPISSLSSPSSHASGHAKGRKMSRETGNSTKEQVFHASRPITFPGSSPFLNGSANCDRIHVLGYHHHHHHLEHHPSSGKRSITVDCTKQSREIRTDAETITPSHHHYDHHHRQHHDFSSSGRPVIIGGTSLDLVLSVEEETIVNDGRTHAAKIMTVPGGVGRNVAEALSKLGHNPLFISAIGDDLFGREVLRNFTQNGMDNTGVSISSKLTPTAVYSALLNHRGECLFGLGDMSIHGEILPGTVEEHAETIGQASVVLMDGNIPVETMTTVLTICSESSVPVWFEPTEIRKARKILQVPSQYWGAVQYISPNIRELISMSDCEESLRTELEESVRMGEIVLEEEDEEQDSSPGGNNNMRASENRNKSNLFSQLVSHCFTKFPSLKIILLTRGARGFSVIQREGKSFRSAHFPPPEIPSEKLRSVSGAGDCLNAGFITGLVANLPLDECAALGTHCAQRSLETKLNVPVSFHLSLESITKVKKNEQKTKTAPGLSVE